jgi:membrane protein YdbS with pleckstrin-like domain
MDWDNMRAEWQSRPDPKRGGLPLPDEARRLWRTIRLRDFIETAVALVLAIFFAVNVVLLWMGGLKLAAVFSAWLVVACIVIAIRLRNARRLFPDRESDLPLRAFLERERLALARQRRLLSTVLRWYVGPIMIGVLGFFVSIRGWHWHSLAYAAVVVLIGFTVERANRHAVSKQIEPAIGALDEQIRQLEEDDEE